MLPIDFLPGSHEDFAQSFNWYASKSLGAAERFMIAINSALTEIASEPERFAKIDSRHRERLVRKFPFRIVYRILDNSILIVAVAHAKRRPDYWKSR
jgi:plasmid stabilization system protein ParE